jgi:hypothetical protein
MVKPDPGPLERIEPDQAVFTCDFSGCRVQPIANVAWRVALDIAPAAGVM